MKKGGVIGIIIGILILLAIFFLFYFVSNEESDTENVCINCSLTNNTLNSTINEDQEITQETPVKNNISNTLCNQLPTSSEFSLEDNYYCLAVVNKDISFCEKIVEEKTESITESEEELNDKTPYYVCLSAVNRNSSYRKLVKQDAKKTCYNTLAQLSWNINVCGDIDYSEKDKQECYFNFVNALYWENKSSEITIDYCDKISDSHDKKTCLAFKERDVSLCGDNKNCLTFFPQELSFCNGATFKDEDECLRDRALTNRDISICNKLSTQTKIDDCYGDFANHIQHEITLCDKIVEIQRKRGCYINTAINLAE